MRTFPQDYYREFFRLKKISYDPASVRRPQYFGSLTNDEGIRVKKVQDSGSVEFHGIKFGIGRAHAGHRVCVMDAGKTVMVFDLKGTLIIEHPWPKPGTTYVISARPRGPRKTL